MFNLATKINAQRLSDSPFSGSLYVIYILKLKTVSPIYSSLFTKNLQ